MKSAFLAVMAMTGALSLAVAGTASASALGHPKPKPKHKPPVATAPQVSGAALQNALLPADDFGDGFQSVFAFNSGKKLVSAKVQFSVPGMSCGDFEPDVSSTGYGNTAGADDIFLNPNWDGGPSIGSGDEYVLQFPSTKAAATYYGQARTKYQNCQNFSEENPGDPNPGGGTVEVSGSTLTKTTVGKYQAFGVIQLAALSEASGDTDYNDILVVVAGTNVYRFTESSGTNDEPSATLMAQLISQVQKLYPRG